MNTQKLNETIQWTGTLFVLIMYAVMNLAPELAPWNLVAGAAGGTCYLVWSFRTQNRPQVIVNLAGVSIALAGLVAFMIAVQQPVVTAPLEGSTKADHYERDMKPDCVDPKDRTD
jgi:hypothetical protein